jgi:hypothetical protein
MNNNTIHPLQIAIQTVNFFGSNFVHNLDFIPDDKLTFKPSPTANSALEITQQAAGHLLNMKAALSGGHFGDVPVEVPDSRATAQQLITHAATDYATWMKTLDTSDFGENVELPFGLVPRGQCVLMPVLDLVHHHGQIAYIQTILGDTQNHFVSITL